MTEIKKVQILPPEIPQQETQKPTSEPPAQDVSSQKRVSLVEPEIQIIEKMRKNKE